MTLSSESFGSAQKDKRFTPLEALLQLRDRHIPTDIYKRLLNLEKEAHFEEAQEVIDASNFLLRNPLLSDISLIEKIKKSRPTPQSEQITVSDEEKAARLEPALAFDNLQVQFKKVMLGNTPVSSEGIAPTLSPEKHPIEKEPAILKTRRFAAGKALRLLSNPVVKPEQAIVLGPIPDFTGDVDRLLYGTNCEKINSPLKVAVKGGFAESHLDFDRSGVTIKDKQPDHAFGAGFVRSFVENRRQYFEAHSITDSFYSSFKSTRRPHFNISCELLTDNVLTQLYLDGYAVFSSLIHYTPPFLNNEVTDGSSTEEKIFHARSSKQIPVNLLGLEKLQVPAEKKAANQIDAPMHFLDFIQAKYSPEQQQVLEEYLSKLYVRLKSKPKLPIDTAVKMAWNTNFEVYDTVLVDKQNPAIPGTRLEPIEMTLIVDALNYLLLKNGDRKVPITFSIGAVFQYPVDLLFVSNPEEWNKLAKYNKAVGKNEARIPYDDLQKGFDSEQFSSEKQHVISTLKSI